MFTKAIFSSKGTTEEWYPGSADQLSAVTPRLQNTRGILIVSWSNGDSITVEDFREAKLAVEIYRGGIEGWIVSTTNAGKLVQMIAGGSDADGVSEYCRAVGEPF